MQSDYIPRKNVAFFNFQKNMVQMVVTNAAAWGIPPAAVGAFQTASAVYSPHWQNISNPATKTKGMVLMHNQSRKRFEKTVRQFVNQWLASNTALKVGDKTNLGLKERESKKHRRPHLLAAPDVYVMSHPGSRMLVVCREEGDSTRPSIPKYADGVEVAYSVGTRPAHVGETTEHFVTLKARPEIRLETGTAGKFFYAFARWVNLRDHTKNGPWSNPAEGMVMY